MAKSTVHNIKLGLFVVAGLFFLILLLYMIGKNKNLFGANFLLKAQFDNIQGLVPGNNVRFAGIEIGTVKSIRILNDTLIEVSMVVKRDMQPFIRKNAVVSIGTDGLVGNKLLNITPAKSGQEPVVQEGDILRSRKMVSPDEMLGVLQETNNDIAFVAENLKNTIQRINTSSALWSIINDSTLPVYVRSSMANLHKATLSASLTLDEFQQMITDVNQGKGSVGALLKDTLFASNLNAALVKIQRAGNSADTLAQQVHAVVQNIRRDLDEGDGPAHAFLKDSVLVSKIHNSLENIEKGTAGFKQNMEALKNSFLLRRYIRKLEKQQAAQSKVSLK